MKRLIWLTFIGISIFFLIGCATIPKDVLKPSEDYLTVRQLQMRKFDTTNQGLMLAAVAGVLQDLGFTIEETESDVGLIVAAKDAEAVNPGEVTVAILADLLNAFSGTYSSYTSDADATQKVRASVVTHPSLESNNTVVRVTFQRIVWSFDGDINHMETVNEESIYVVFYDQLSKAVFLEAHEI